MGAAFAEAGAIVIDNSSRWRMEDDVPLVVSEVNPDALAQTPARGIIANPNCSTMQMVVALKPLHDAARHRATRRRTYQAVSGTGRAASTSCSTSRTRCCIEASIRAARRIRAPDRFNALPHAGSFADGDGHTDEERKLINETRKILGDPGIRVSATCVRVPVVNGHSEAVNVQTRDRSPPSARASCSPPRPASSCSTTPPPASTRSPSTPPAATRCSSVASAATPATSARSTCGSSPTTCARAPPTNAVQIAELLHQRGLVHARGAAPSSA